ncbi:Holliday junction resolvase RuvX [Synechococcus sp. ROS8604]|uniref:Holliday junction resolvase RuvX n=1 Tax=Synechococcus sp. ROS8604 TaxID=1442557 RepID=UPI00164513F4|nr:Holliday junction resolvase RuvX [Synechococcus sp. ROS8604]QNI88966.1 DNA damage response protein YqgF / putative pre-16S rRNA nuclease [Synechococcus sp. ROS8604]
MLSLDVGRKRIGLAGCDALGITVRPLPALFRRTFKHDLEHLGQVCLTRRVQGLVVGLPLDAEGQFTEQAGHCQRYGQRLAMALKLPLALVNEHSSSWAAADRHGLQGDRSGRLDSAAAALLLEQWLSDGQEPEPVDMATPSASKTDGNEGS